ncbi:hypothetical protein KP509_23G010700 [Ceratopteris richardii]|uniref:Uncharacterized protein n=1 Tax=Ceratopteris richardii TaxID=49495 RepID=A0A8T2RZR4_CERRI|nr:hypothetical protein KP509_23G010700 [Ceratopteris richardii]
MVISAERAAAETIHGCGGFVEASSDLAKARKSTDPKPDYLHITVELQIIDGLVKDRVQCVPNGYYFLPIYDKEFSLSGKVIGVVGDPSYSAHAVDGPQDVKVSIKRVSNPQDSSISVLTFPKSGFKFDNVIPGVYELQAEYPMLVVHSSSEPYIELDYGDLDICDICYLL